MTPKALDDLAREALAEVAAGGRCRRGLAVDLARAAVVAGVGGRWALDVLEGAATETRAVVELAVAVLTGGLAMAARERAREGR